MSRPKPKSNVAALFNKFAGREVPMTETKRTFNIGGRAITVNDIQPADKNDPAIREMHDTAKKHGMTLRLFWPGMAGTCDYRTDRINANIEKADDGKWRVAKHFQIG